MMRSYTANDTLARGLEQGAACTTAGQQLTHLSPRNRAPERRMIAVQDLSIPTESITVTSPASKQLASMESLLRRLTIVFPNWTEA